MIKQHSNLFSSYVIPCIILSILLNVPKFLESKFVWREVNKTVVDPDTNETSVQVEEVRNNSILMAWPVFLNVWSLGVGLQRVEPSRGP